MSVGKEIRLQRLISSVSGKGILVPIDHGFTMGPIPGIESTQKISQWIQNHNINGIIAHKGIVERLGRRGLLANLGIVVHLNGMTNLSNQPDNKEMLTSLEQALCLGADAVSIQLNFSGENDGHNWKMLGQLVDKAAQYQIPVLTMLYDKAHSASPGQSVQRIKTLLRSCVELGSDAVKIGISADLSLMDEILQDLAEDIKVFVAGGDLTSESYFLHQISKCLMGGAAGVCVGRNIFSRKPVAPFLQKISETVHKNLTSLTITSGELCENI